VEIIVTRTRTGIRIGGFTLVELMIVVLVAAILFSIAVPTYQSQVRKSRRTDAKTAVLDLAAREEKYLSLNNSYTATATNLGYTSFPQVVGGGYYNLYVCVSTPAAGNAGTMSASAVACPGTATTTGLPAYVVSAIPVAGTSQANDSSCQYFAVDSTGTQYASSSTGIGTNTVSTCW
jgi:type IV pilus assembly protein PilE